MAIKEGSNGQLKFDFSKDVTPKSKQDYEFEAAKYQAEHPVKPTKPTSFHDLNSENRELLSDEEYSDMMLQEQEYMEDLRDQWAEEAARKAEKKASSAQLDGAPKNNRRLPAGYTNSFPVDDKGNMYDDGFSFDEKD